MADRAATGAGTRAAALLGAALLLPAVVAAPAAADATTIPNACRYSFDGYWRNLDLRWGASLAPAPVAPGGTASAGALLTADLPDWMAQYGFNSGLLRPGENEIPVRVWTALGVTGGTPAVVRMQTRAVARTTIAVGPLGEFRSATPMRFVARLPEEPVTAGSSGGLAVSQAGPGSLARIAADAAGGAVTPRGSLYARAELANGTRFDLDCQPGRYAADGNAFTPGPTAVLARVAIDPAAVVRRPPVIGQAALRPTRSGRVRVSVRNRDAEPTAIAVRARVREGGRWSTIGRGTGAVRATTTARVPLRLTAKGRRLLRREGRLRVRIEARATGGATAVRTVTVRR